jgi:hypothetical protein
MATFMVRDRVYEVTPSSPVHEPGHHFECWDLTPVVGGMVGTIVVSADDGPTETEFRFLRPVALTVLRRWIHFIPELAEGIRPSNPD